MRLLPPLLACLLAAAPAEAQEQPGEGQSEVAFQRYLAGKPVFRAQVAAFDRWLTAKRVGDILPTYQILRTASMWSECNGPPFEVPPRKHWPRIAATLRFVRDHVRPALGPLAAVSAYRNPALNVCAHGAANSAHRDFSAIDLVPIEPLTRRQLFRRICPLHQRKGPASQVGLGFYAFTRFHIDTRRFRRWGSAGPGANESPCAVLERGGDPEAPPLPRQDAQPLPPGHAGLDPASAFFPSPPVKKADPGSSPGRRAALGSLPRSTLR